MTLQERYSVRVHQLRTAQGELAQLQAAIEAKGREVLTLQARVAELAELLEAEKAAPEVPAE